MHSRVEASLSSIKLRFISFFFSEEGRGIEIGKLKAEEAKEEQKEAPKRYNKRIPIYIYNDSLRKPNFTPQHNLEAVQLYGQLQQKTPASYTARHTDKTMSSTDSSSDETRSRSFISSAIIGRKKRYRWDEVVLFVLLFIFLVCGSTVLGLYSYLTYSQNRQLVPVPW